MKKLILIPALILGMCTVFAQKIKESEVPTAVKAKLTALYPNAKNPSWEKEKANYEAEFMNGKEEISVLLDASGNLIESETEISVSALPKAVTEYCAKNLAGKKIKEASKITEASGKVKYEAEIEKSDYMFDEAGNFIEKKEK